MDSHVRIIGILNIVFGIMGLFASAIAFLAIAGGGLISGDPMAIQITSIVAVSVSSIIAFVSIPEIVAGIGILKLKSWGRIFGIVIAVLNLLSIPIGTAFGIYSLWVLMNDETETIFNSSREELVVEKE
jgi:hypothetical protein